MATHLLTKLETADKLVQAYLTSGGLKYRRVEKNDVIHYFLGEKSRKVAINCIDVDNIHVSFFADGELEDITRCVGSTMGDLQNMVKKIKTFLDSK